MRNSSDGHYVLVEESGKVLKTSRIVPYNTQDEEEQDQDLKELGWIQLTDPEGRTFYLNNKTGETSWDTPLMKFGCNAVVKKRVSYNRRVKGFEPIGQVAKYLGPMRNSSEGHYVLVEESGKVLKTSRIVPYDAQDEEEQDQDLKELGWIQLTDPE